MLSIAIGAALAVAIIRIARFETGRSRGNHQDLIHKRPRLPVLGVQIICGDCSGDEVAPIKTYMDHHGACETCGGGSYMLASRRGSEMDQKRVALLLRRPAATQPAGQEPAKSGRLLAFRTSAGRGRAN